MRARSYAFVRFGLKGATEVRGDIVLNNTCVSSEESALLPLLSRWDAQFCLLCQALSNFFWDRAHSILDGTTVSGGVEVFLTDLPTEAAGFFAIRIRQTPQMTRLLRCLTSTSVRKSRSWTRITLRSSVCHVSFTADEYICQISHTCAQF